MKRALRRVVRPFLLGLLIIGYAVLTLVEALASGVFAAYERVRFNTVRLWRLMRGQR